MLSSRIIQKKVLRCSSRAYAGARGVSRRPHPHVASARRENPLLTAISSKYQVTDATKTSGRHFRSTARNNMGADDKIEVLLYGLGAIGSVYAFILNRNPRVRLSVCARSNYDVVRENGMTIRSKNHGEHNFMPAKVLRTPAEAGQTYDYIYCVNKAVQTDLVLQQLAPVVDQQKTTIAVMQNGVGNEEPFRKAFPGCTILSGVVSQTPT